MYIFSNGLISNDIFKGTDKISCYTLPISLDDTKRLRYLRIDFFLRQLKKRTFFEPCLF